MVNNWKVNDDFAESNRFKFYAKKYPQELKSCSRNLADLVEKLDLHGNLAQIKFGFFRSEGREIWRIGQTGLPHAPETRLYIYLYVQGQKVYLLTIGDKKQQPDDLRRCAELVQKIKRSLQP